MCHKGRALYSLKYIIKQNSLKYSDEEVKSKVINSITEWGIFTKEDIQIVKV